MKILLPSAKEMATPKTNARMLPLRPKSQSVLTAMASLDLDDLVQVYKISSKMAEQEADRIKNLISGQAAAYPAWQLFDGLMYRQIERQELSQAQETYVGEHVYIASALYGVINAFEMISPHRLDFLTGIKVSGQSLKQYWRSAFDDAVASDEVLISLLSSEFETVFSKETQERMITLTFMEEVKGQLKVHSTISKKARGQFVNALIAQEITDPAKLKSLQVAGFAYREGLSEERNWVFVKSV